VIKAATRDRRMKQRRPKRKRIDYVPTSQNDNDGHQEEHPQQRSQLNEVARRPGVLPSRVPKFSQVPQKERSEEMKMEGPSEKEAESQAPFCCAVCACCSGRKERVEMNRFYVFNWFELEAIPGCWHRRCCHGQYEIKSANFTLPLVHANMTIENILCNREQEKQESIPVLYELEWVTKGILINSYRTAKSQEAELYNNDKLETATQKLLTNEEYNNNIGRPYNDLKEQDIKPLTNSTENSTENEGITVLDCFAGIGIAILVLKKLNIKIKTIIHVEHDKLATHVYRWNHDSEYNTENRNDGIHHVFMKKFEKLVGVDQHDQERKFNRLWKKANGKPIDIVIGGPPCTDYSKVNAYRQGTKGEQGGYLVRFGKFIRSLELAQKRKFQKEKTFFSSGKCFAEW